ncbi:MAG: hypothetical protein ACP5N1_00880 [Candidatus Woesearchaeota archaeon]
MHPEIKTEFQKLLNSPVDNMLAMWINLKEVYFPPEDRLKDIAFDGQRFRPYMTLEDTVTILNSIGEKLFTAEISIKKPHLIIDFMNEYWDCTFLDQLSNQSEYFEDSKIYKDACAMDLYNSIVEGITHPDADPYFRYDPEHPKKMLLEYGVERRLFTQSDIEEILKNQDKNSKSYKKVSKSYSKEYRKEHTPFGVNYNNRYNDYGFHVFIGKIKGSLYDDSDIVNDEEFNYVLLNSTITFGLGNDMGNVVDYLWESVRKNQKVLLTKSPGGNLEKLSSEELSELYTWYFSDVKHLELPDPFLNQPE